MTIFSKPLGFTQSYHASSMEQQQVAYDQRAKKFESDLCAMGYRIPAMIVAVFTRFVALDTAPILDTGCGAGIESEALAMLGYGRIMGIDLSEGMLDNARDKGTYAELHQMTLGEQLNFSDDTFAALLLSRTITPKHALAHSFDELIWVAILGAPIVLSLRDDATQEPDYPEVLSRLTASGAWQEMFVTESLKSMPCGQPEISHRVHVYEVS